MPATHGRGGGRPCAWHGRSGRSSDKCEKRDKRRSSSGDHPRGSESGRAAGGRGGLQADPGRGRRGLVRDPRVPHRYAQRVARAWSSWPSARTARSSRQAIDTWDPDVRASPTSGCRRPAPTRGSRVARAAARDPSRGRRRRAQPVRRAGLRAQRCSSRARAAARTSSRSGSATSEELIGAIEAVARGGSVIDPMIVDVLIEARARADAVTAGAS